MSVGIVGSGPAATAVEAALADVDVGTESRAVPELHDVELAVVVGQAGDTVFERVSEQALDSGLRWVAVELGGLGGIPIADAAVAGFGPSTGCYECLTGRVSANLDPQTEPAAAPPAHTSRFAGAVAGREATRYLNGDADIFGRIVVVPYTEREFLALPNCACDPGRDRTLTMEYVDRPLEESLTRAERALDDQVGLVQEVGEAESFPVPYYLARSCDTSGFSDVSAARDAAGVAPDWDGAFMKALGETLERYCAGIYRTATLTDGAPDAVADAVAPSAFVCETEPDPTTAIHWVDGKNLSTGETVKLPAEFVQYPPPTRRSRSPVTTGLGLGNSPVEALLAGLYEVVERDALMLSWYSSFEPLGLSIDDELFQNLCDRASSEGLSVTPLLVTQDIDVPVVVVAVQREAWPRLALGSAANLSVSEAARSALGEALQNWMELRGMGPDDATQALGAIGRYADTPGPAASFVDPETTIPADSTTAETVPTGTDELESVVERVSDAGLGVYGARTTTRDVEQLGFEAVRALVPAAQPLCFDTIYFGDRARTVPDELGFSPTLERDHHPFP